MTGSTEVAQGHKRRSVCTRRRKRLQHIKAGVQACRRGAELAGQCAGERRACGRLEAKPRAVGRAARCREWSVAVLPREFVADGRKA